ncbi:hypothetical protein FRC17_003698 [Serendipita sp. 399]|nr:hypothetical protein FRC17_003698 [Serendipita sp. 399]
MNDLEGALKNAQLAYDAVARPSPPSRRLSFSTTRTAVATPETDSRKTLYQSLLSGVLCARYKRLGNKEDLDGAIAHAEAILQATPSDHPLYEMYKSIHAFALQASGPEERASSPEDVIAQVREEAEQAKAAKDPNWGRIMLRLCNLLYARYEQNLETREEGEESKVAEDLDLELVLGDWRKIATAGLRTVPSPPSVRFRAALKWADVACREGRYKSAVDAYKVAMSLAPRVSLARRKGVVDESDMVEAAPGEENELLLNTFSLASDAAAAAIDRGQLETAIEFVEQSRSLLWKDALGLPSDMDRLEAINPGLASHLSEVLEELEQSIHRASPDSAIAKPDVRAPWLTAPREKVKPESSADDRWNSIVGTVRASEAGFQNFLRPWSLDSLREEDAPVPVGPVVILNSSYLRCDAIILVSTNEPVLVPLEQTSKADLERLAAQVVTGVKELEEGSATGFQFDKAVMEPVLKELWERVISPVLKKLDEVAFGGGKHVGLVPTGAFTWLPLHAATAIRNGTSRKSSDDGEATPSRPDPTSKYSFYYATTLQSLLHSPRNKPTSSSRVLVVSDQPSRRASLLGGIVTSVQALKLQLSTNTEGAEDPIRSNIHIESLEGPAVAVPDAIFKALRPAPVIYESGEETEVPEGVDAVHFSCPTFCDALRPASSSWKVADGSSVRISDFFMSWFYSQRREATTLPEFVFSSTTSHRIDGPVTAGSGAVRLPQELMTPEAALQFAGVKGVIGQLWNAKSEDASVVATHVYKAVVANGGALREDRATHTHPITGKVVRGRGLTSPHNRSSPVGQPQHGPVWETKGLEDGVVALRASNVPLFRTVPFVRYGP